MSKLIQTTVDGITLSSLQSQLDMADTRIQTFSDNIPVYAHDIFGVQSTVNNGIASWWPRSGADPGHPGKYGWSGAWAVKPLTHQAYTGRMEISVEELHSLFKAIGDEYYEPNT